MYQRLVFDFFGLGLWQRHAIAGWLGVAKLHPDESELDYGRRILMTANEAGRLEELANRVRDFQADIAA
jgi:hypothetical protein